MQFRDEISHQWARRYTLRQYREGMISKDSICDADFLLVTAAKHHGVSASSPCPVCGGAGLRIVQWVYGEKIGKASGSARTTNEIDLLVEKAHECTVHTVEVCSDCKWNHLLKVETAVSS